MTHTLDFLSAHAQYRCITKRTRPRDQKCSGFLLRTMANRGSALLLLFCCCISTCLADTTFNETLVGVIVVISLLLGAIVAVAVSLLVVWFRSQRKPGESDTAALRLESNHTLEKEEEDEREDENRDEVNHLNHCEPPQMPAPVYSTIAKANLRAPSPVGSFTSDVDEVVYHNTPMKPARPAPPTPANNAKELNEYQDVITVKAEDKNKTSSSRRPPPPKPMNWGEELEAVAKSLSQDLSPVPIKEEPQPSPLAVKLRPVPPGKPRSTGPPEPPTKPHSARPSTSPREKPLSFGLPVPPTKPHTSGPPAPPTKPRSAGPPAPPEKPQTKGPTVPPNKPVPSTKPKPQVLPRHVGHGSSSDGLSPGVSPKPKLKPQVPTKPGTRDEGTSVPVSVAKFGEHVASLHADGNTGFSRQYNSLPTGEFGQAIFDALLPLHACRNRYPNIIPYNDNRPKLQPIAGSRECQHDYINASYINGLSSPHKYIAAQGPKLITVVDFWRMVWQEGVPTIAMVTSLREGSESKCERYWPDFGTEQYGPYLVSLSEQQVLANYTLSTLEIQFVLHGKQGKPRTLKHMHFTAWQDNDSPEQAGPLLSYLRRLQSLHNPSVGPLLVHCSAGVGRTGSLLAIDLALEQAAKENCIDIPAIVTSLRRQRMKMIQSEQQYRFVHDAVLEQLVCGDTQIQAPNFRRALQKLQQQKMSAGVLKTGLALQYDVLEQISLNPDDVACQRAMLNPDKNRTTNYLPLDERSVILQGKRYIHASFAHGYRQKNAFIIAQAPLEETCRDFWKMVYETGCGVIVMLSNNLTEGQLCAQYWSEGTDGFDRQYGELSIRTMQHQQMSGYLIHKMAITNRRSGTKREAVQFQVATWTRGDICSSPSTLVETIHHIKAAQRRAGNKPIIVHGSDTVSRCGVFCALVAIIDQCMVEGVVDVFQAVKTLRLCKPGSVHTLAQYQSLFRLMTEYLDSFDTYANFN